MDRKQEALVRVQHICRKDAWWTDVHLDPRRGSWIHRWREVRGAERGAKAALIRETRQLCGPRWMNPIAWLHALDPNASLFESVNAVIEEKLDPIF